MTTESFRDIPGADSSNFVAVAREVLVSMGPGHLNTEAGWESVAHAILPDHEWSVLHPKWRRTGAPQPRPPEITGPTALLVPAERLRLGPQSLLTLFRDWGWSPSVVLEGTLNPSHALLPIVLVTLSRVSQGATAPTRFFQAPTDPDQQDQVLSDVKRLLKAQGGSTGYGWVYRGDLHPNSWSATSNDPKIDAKLADLGALRGTVPMTSLLEEVFDVLMAPPKHRSDVEPTQAPWPALTAGDVIRGVLNPVDDHLGAKSDRAGHTTRSRANRRERTHSSGLELQSGDILMTAFERTEIHRPLLVTAEDLPLHAGPHIFVLRPRQALTPAEVDLYVAYLGSNRSRQLLHALAPSTGVCCTIR